MASSSCIDDIKVNLMDYGCQNPFNCPHNGTNEQGRKFTSVRFGKEKSTKLCSHCLNNESFKRGCDVCQCIIVSKNSIITRRKTLNSVCFRCLKKAIPGDSKYCTTLKRLNLHMTCHPDESFLPELKVLFTKAMAYKVKKASIRNDTKKTETFRFLDDCLRYPYIKEELFDIIESLTEDQLVVLTNCHHPGSMKGFILTLINLSSMEKKTKKIYTPIKLKVSKHQ